MASVGHDRGVRCWAPLANQLHALQGSDRSHATSSITGSKPPQEGHAGMESGEGPMDHRPRIFCPAAGVPSKDRTDITRGTLQALRHIKARARLLPNFYPERPGSILFRSVETFILGHSLTHWFPSLHPLPCSPASPLRILFTCIRCQPPACAGPALLPHHHDRRAWLLQITQITPVRSLGPVCMERPREPLVPPSFFPSDAAR